MAYRLISNKSTLEIASTTFRLGAHDGACIQSPCYDLRSKQSRQQKSREMARGNEANLMKNHISYAKSAAIVSGRLQFKPAQMAMSFILDARIARL